MKIIFVGAVVLSLVVMISSQDITLTPQDATCIQNEALSSETDILQACSADELAWLAQGDVTHLCENMACFDVFRAVYSTCGREDINTAIEMFCNGTEQGLTIADLMCIQSEVEAAANGINDACTSSDIAALRAGNAAVLCDNMACFDEISAVYTACGREDINDAVRTICSGSVRLYTAPVIILLTALLALIF